ncbi:MAG TPA: BON domain-containing protein [Gemmatimonadales bacterium]|nr:BON domain-containing protein [Gemmatimonadales bacterium]
MRYDDRLSRGEVAGWGGLGFLSGFVLGLALSAWAGDVNRDRIGRATKRLREPVRAPRATPAAVARSARAALASNPLLRALAIEARAVGARSVELRGWVESRALRAAATRAVRTAPGVDTVINNILVRGEDDRTLDHPTRGGQTA